MIRPISIKLFPRTYPCWAATRAGLLLLTTVLFAPAAKAQFHNGVNIHSGIKVEVVSDYEAPTGHLNFKRYYSSANMSGNPSKAHGSNWRHVFEASLSLGVEYIRANRPSGNSYFFRKLSSGWSPPDADVKEQLSPVLVNGVLVAWRLVLRDDRIEQYDASGVLRKVEFQDGDALDLAYENGRLKSVSDRQHRSLSFEYDSEQLTALVLPDGRRVQYGYDNQRLSSVAYQMTDGASPTFATRTYSYASGSAASLLTAIRDESQQEIATWSYDSAGRATSTRYGGVSSPVGYTQFVYGPTSTTVTYAPGDSVSYGRSILYGVPKTSSASKPCLYCTSRTVKSRTYDANGSPDVTADFKGGETDQDYNARGLLTREITARNSTFDKRTVETTWHSVFRSPVERRTYDALGDLIRTDMWTYNVRGQLLSRTVQDPVTGSARTTTKLYCEQSDVDAARCPLVGLLLSVDGPRSNVDDSTLYSYRMSDHSECAISQDTCPWRKGDLWKVTNAMGEVTETLRYDGAGRVLSTSDGNGVITDFDYDPRGRLIRRTTRASN